MKSRSTPRIWKPGRRRWGPPEAGDAFLFDRSLGAVKEKGPLDVGRTLPGLYVSAVKWLKERGVALVGDDVDQDVMPSRIERIFSPYTSCY